MTSKLRYRVGQSRDPAIRELYDIVESCEEKKVDKEIVDRLKSAIELAEKRDAYCESVSSGPSKALETLYDETLAYPFQQAYDDKKIIWNLNPIMISGHFEGKFLQSIVSMSRANHVLEVGMFTGYAALACAEVLPEDGTVTTLELDPFLEDLARGFFDKSPHGKKIKIIIGPAKDSMAKLIKDKAQFDVVFIDADKPGYIDYFKAAVDDNLLAPGGTVVLDNAMMYGHAYLENTTFESGLAIRKVNEYLKTRDDIFRVLVPIRDGALVVRRKSETLK